MFKMQCYTDLVIVVGDVRFPVHGFILTSNSSAFHRFLSLLNVLSSVKLKDVLFQAVEYGFSI